MCLIVVVVVVVVVFIVDDKTELTRNKNVCVRCVRCEVCSRNQLLHAWMNGRMTRLAFLRVRVRADMCVSVGCRSFFLLLGNFP